MSRPATARFVRSRRATGEMITGDPNVDLVLEAGPRTFGPDLPLHAREEIAKAESLGWYRQALLGMAQKEQAQMFAEIAHVCKENREIENSSGFKACNGIGYPYYRCP